VAATIRAAHPPHRYWYKHNKGGIGKYADDVLDLKEVKKDEKGRR
jgi:hypothetical protein